MKRMLGECFKNLNEDEINQDRMEIEEKTKEGCVVFYYDLKMEKNEIE